jgi:beta-mannosidase
MQGDLRLLGEFHGTVGGDAVALTAIAQDTLEFDEMLHFTWATDTGQTGRDIFASRPFKDYDLQPPALTMQVTGNQITVTAKSLALFVAVEADVKGRFDINAFDMTAGETVTVIFSPADSAKTPTFTLRDLHSATYA